MRKYILFTLLAALLMAPVTMDAHKKKDKKYQKKTVTVENIANNAEQPMREVTVTDPAKRCTNARCVCNKEHAPYRFRRTESGALRCWYCDSKIN